MKFLKTAALLGMALAFAGTAKAQTVIHIAGATTFRAPVTQAIKDSLNSGFTWAYDNSAGAPYKAGAAIFTGTLKSNSHAVVFKTFFTGSLAGVADLTSGTSVTGFIPSTVTQTTGGTNVNGTGYTKETAKVDAALTDAQGSTIAAVLAGTGSASTLLSNLNKATLVDAGTNSGDATSAGGAGTVGIAPMAWYLGCVAQAAYNPGITNMTQQNASYIQSNPLPVSFLTGSSADQNSFAFLVGRNEDSGTRIVCLSEAQVTYGTSVIQYAPSFSNNQNTDGTWAGTGTSNPNTGSIQTGGFDSAKTQFSTVTGFQAWNQNSALNTEPAVNWSLKGHSGYISGGDVANVLSSTNPSITTGAGAISKPTSVAPPGSMTNAYFIGYMGIADGGIVAATSFNSGSKPPVGTAATPLILSYNGVPYSVGAIQNGQYTLWTFEHLYYVSASTVSGVSIPTGDALQGINDIANAIFAGDVTVNSSGVAGQPNAAGIQFTTSCLATRTTEGGPLSEDYF